MSKDFQTFLKEGYYILYEGGELGSCLSSNDHTRKFIFKYKDNIIGPSKKVALVKITYKEKWKEVLESFTTDD